MSGVQFMPSNPAVAHQQSNLELLTEDVQDNSCSVLIGVSFAGITVFRAGKTGIHFPWSNVMSIRYKGKKFRVQLKSPNMAILPMNGSVSALTRAPSNVTLTGPSPYPNSDTTLLHTYCFASTSQSKAFWQYAVACHAFFRVREPVVQSDSLFSRLSNRGGSAGTTSISATAVHAAISRVTSGFRRYFSIVRRNSLSTAGLSGPVGGVERTLSTVMELRRNSRASDRGFSRSNSRRSLRRSAVNSIAAASFTQSTGLRTTSNLSLTADRQVVSGEDQIPSNPMPIKSYAQMPPGARVPAINTGSLRLPPATSSTSRPVPITQIGSSALTDDPTHSIQARPNSLNPGSSSRVRKTPNLNEPATGSNLIPSSRNSYIGSTAQVLSDKSSRSKLSKPSSPSMASGVRSSQRRPPQAPQTTSASPALSGRGSEQVSPKSIARSSEPRAKERRIHADLSTRASADLSVSDHSEEADNADFDRDEAARYWHVRRTQAVSRPTRLPSKGRGTPSTMHESFHTRNESDVRIDASSNRSSRHANEYDSTNLAASTEAMMNKSDPLRSKVNSRSNLGRQQLSAISKKTSDGTVIPRKESTSQPELHERTHASAVTHSKGSGHHTSSNFVRDPFHPGAPAGENCSTVEPEVNEGLVWIRIRPDSHGHFGFNIRGGADFGAPIIVSRVAPNMPADLCIPRLSEGDQLIAINGRNVAGHTHAEVNSFIRGAREDQSGLLELLVKPSDYVTDDLNEDSEVPDSGDAPPLPPRTLQPSSRQSSIPLSGAPHRHNVLSGKRGSLVSYAQSLDGTEDPLLLSVLELECGLADGSILTRFEQLPRRKPGYTMNASRLNENIFKNRYRDISPYDQTRVILQQGPGDYINASFVIMDFPKAGFTVNYIAAQGPLPCTYGSFWQMCWEQHVNVVVMLTAVSERGRVKCHQYWPDLGQVLNFSVSNLQAVSNKQSKSTPRNDLILRVQTLREEVS
ncbi:hypothetical protein EG68_04283 [Paragonimus skrjabini miyazakii]|uniref:protein-tyrosine-phosphatase n=1 Tax=Paragonimus skrjabini miyazakii TaxID=59628 RepID=A0A8S9YU53_9TREM|nr:hypothetical protein EG68_04283 [Paragonimus skrjabini miyazakii]